MEFNLKYKFGHYYKVVDFKSERIVGGIFIFELDDEKGGLKYLWTAERTDNGILLYSMHSPVGTPASTACYQEFKQRYVTKSIRSIYHQL